MPLRSDEAKFARNIEYKRTYDSLGRLTSTTFRNGAGAALLSHGYTQFDAMDRRKKVSREDGKEWNYDYDARGQVTAARKKFSASEGGEWLAGWQTTYAYDTIGNRVTSAAGGDAAGANLREGTYTANALNQYTQRTVPGSLVLTGEAAPAATVDVTVNEQPVTPVVRQGPTRAKSFFAAEYQADNSTQGTYGVSRVRATTSGSAPVGQVDWFYIQKTPEVFTYDTDGNLTSDDRWTYTWDAESRLLSVETRPDRLRPNGVLPLERRLKLEFAYDAQGRRLQKKVSTWNATTSAWVLSTDQRFVYDQWNCLAYLAVQGSSTTLQCAYAWGLDLSGSLYGAGGVGGLLAQTTATTGVSGDYLYAYDGNGNVSGLLSAATGTLAAEYDYSAFGELLKSTGPMANVNGYRFSTKCQDESGLYYYGFRYYNPSTGRWLNREPLGESASKNLYSFAANNLTNDIDVLGLYGVAGHFYTVYAVAIARGYDRDAAYALAFYAQLPDQVAQYSAFDSVPRTARDLVTEKQWLRRIQEELHSLHGGDVAKRRACLKKLLSDPGLFPFERGLLAHAFGDSYAHTFVDEKGVEQSYGFPFGHAFTDHGGHEPDLPVLRPDLYKTYVNELFNALPEGPNGSSKNRLRSVLNTVDLLPSQDPNATEFIHIDRLRSASFYSRPYRPELGGHSKNPPQGKDSLGDLSPELVQNLLDRIKKGCCP